MKIFIIFGLCAALSGAVASASSASEDGIKALADRWLHGHGDQFTFELTEKHDKWSRWNIPPNDNYTVSSQNGKIHIQGTTRSALARGLRHYANNELNLDEFLFFESAAEIPDTLPLPETPYSGASVVPWRYNLNTVTFSYSFVWYTWPDWEKFLDWAALRGVNIQLAWVGYEKIYLDSFRELGLTDDEILPFFTGAAFQAWNRFGNIHGTWGGEGLLSTAWIDQQFELQRKIVPRMVELGITPALPAFPGFVPEAFKRIRPDAHVEEAHGWGDFPDENSHTLFLSPLEETYAELQNLFLTKQLEAYGNVTNIYTLDQFNEIQPNSGDAEYLAEVSVKTYQGLTDVNPASIWLMQGWLFFAEQKFWSQDRIKAYLSGPTNRQDMLILELFSESIPQWQRINSYEGRPWMWCQLHDFGAKHALHGRVTNLTVNSMQALEANPNLVGFGLTNEGFESTEIVHDILLDQAWAKTPIDTHSYFQEWARLRYAGAPSIPEGLYTAWDILREHVFDVKDNIVPNVGTSVFQLAPALSGLVNRTGHYPAPTALAYDPAILQEVWRYFRNATIEQPELFNVPAFQFDFVDLTRQVMGNAFIDIYEDLISSYNDGKEASEVSDRGSTLLQFLRDIDTMLSTNDHFALERWLTAAKSWGEGTGALDAMAFNARSQITVWGVVSSLNDYAAKAWSGLTRSYYAKRWSIFIDMLVDAVRKGDELDEEAHKKKNREFEISWQYKGYDAGACPGRKPDLSKVVEVLVKRWSGIFGG